MTKQDQPPMTLRLFNTLTGQLDPLAPATGPASGTEIQSDAGDGCGGKPPGAAIIGAPGVAWSAGSDARAGNQGAELATLTP